jgi:hypothetical protein
LSLVLSAASEAHSDGLRMTERCCVWNSIGPEFAVVFAIIVLFFVHSLRGSHSRL